jgi:hypothetical protein
MRWLESSWPLSILANQVPFRNGVVRRSRDVLQLHNEKTRPSGSAEQDVRLPEYPFRDSHSNAANALSVPLVHPINFFK